MASSLSDPIPFSHASHSHLLPAIASLHASCITESNAVSFFHPPLSLPSIEAWWESQIQSVEAGTKVLVINLNPAHNDQVLGAALLSVPWSQTGPFRSTIEGVWVKPEWQRRGLGSNLLRKLEEVAKGMQRGLIMAVAEVSMERFWVGNEYKKVKVSTLIS